MHVNKYNLLQDKSKKPLERFFHWSYFTIVPDTWAVMGIFLNYLDT